MNTAYDFEIYWKDPELQPGTALQNAEHRIKTQSVSHGGTFHVFEYPFPNKNGWLYLTRRQENILPYRMQPILSYRVGLKIFPIC